jgi:hypothetical protein
MRHFTKLRWIAVFGFAVVLCAGIQLARGWNPTPPPPDTDGDGLTDAQEVRLYGTNPNKPDTDDDGLADGLEVALGTSPTAANPTQGQGGSVGLQGLHAAEVRTASMDN